MSESNQANAAAPAAPKKSVKAKPASASMPVKAATKAVKATKPAASRKVAVNKPVAKKASTAKAAKAPQAQKPAKPAKAVEPKKPKLVRDSFTLPQADHDLIKLCKKTAVSAGRETKKSEVVRAAIQSFAALSKAAQLAAYTKLQPIALGRPKAK